MSWLVFYPRTMWRAVRHPLETMSRGETDLGLPPEDQFRDILSPPIFLLLTVLLAHVLAVELVGDRSLIDSKRGLAALISDDTSLILLRILVFAAVPIVVASFAARVFGQPLDRSTLQPIFYAQCYATTPTVLAFSAAGTLSQISGRECAIAAATMLLAGSLYYLGAETGWFKRELKRSWISAAAYALGVFGISTIILIGSALLFA